MPELVEPAVLCKASQFRPALLTRIDSFHRACLPVVPEGRLIPWRKLSLSPRQNEVLALAYRPDFSIRPGESSGHA